MRKNKTIIGIIIFIIIYIMLLFNINKDTIGLTIMMTIIILLVLTPIIIVIRNDRKRKKEFLEQFKTKTKNNTNYEYKFEGCPVEKILSPKELEFYNLLKPIAEKYNMLIFSKIRLADIIKTSNKIDLKKVWARHIDFVITDIETSPLLYIELDDVSHTYEETIIRDEKKNIIFESAGLHLIRVKTTEIERKLQFIESILMNKKRA